MNSLLRQPNAIVTVDGAVVVDGTRVVLIRRAKPPFADQLVLPGGHAEPGDASLALACARELGEEIGLDIAPERLSLLAVLDAPGADPRYAARVSIVFRIDITLKEFSQLTAGSDAASLELADIGALRPEDMGFDHYAAILAIRKENGQ